MGVSCGLIGLANVGKTTVFNALLGGKALVANYPFSTVETNVGIAAVPDPRLPKLSQIFKSRKITPSTLEVRDIAGLVEGASQGEGLGNQFLAQIREVDALIHIVRCFEASDVIHVGGAVDPVRDVETVETELMLADLETLGRRRQRAEKRVKSGGDEKAKKELEALDQLTERLNRGRWLAHETLGDEEVILLNECQLLSGKPLLILANAAEGASREHPSVKPLSQLAEDKGAPLIVLWAQLEAEVASLTPDEQRDYLRELGFKESGLVQLTQAAYALLSLLTFFTAGEEESRAWPLRSGTKASRAAGKIHSDMERGFIRAEVYPYVDLIACGTVAGVREKGLFRLEGRDYVIQEGDVVYFRFNV
ncbi:MAG: redox-regulated ATPase YchF [Nitrospirales bacterium]